MPDLFPELIVTHARLYDPATGQQLPHNALAVQENRIVALGSDEEISALATPHSRRINARGCWLLPALVDAHTHLTEYALRKGEVDLSRCRSLSEALSLIAQRVQRTPRGQWICGGGWDWQRWGLATFPDRSLLDAISTDHPMAFSSRDWHSLWVNSPALQQAGLSEETPEPDGGKILRRPGDGTLQGILQEEACKLVYRAIPEPDLSRQEEWFQAAFADFHRMGITATHVMETPREWHHYRRLATAGRLKLRVTWYCFVEHFSALQSAGLRSGEGNAWLQVGGIKLFADGSLGSRTAHLIEPYQGEHHCGVEVLTREQLLSHMQEAARSGLASAVHAIGDRAVRNVLDAFQSLMEQDGKTGLPHRMEHAQLIDPQDLPRFARLGIAVSAQPIHLAEDIPPMKALWGERARHAFPFRALLAQNTLLAFGSDAPVETIDPWKGIYMALTRKPHLDPGASPFFPEQALSLEEALRAYCWSAHQMVGLQDRLGRLHPGYLADFILLKTDLWQAPPEALLENPVVLTCLNGEIVYQDEDFFQ